MTRMTWAIASFFALRSLRFCFFAELVSWWQSNASLPGRQTSHHFSRNFPAWICSSSQLASPLSTSFRPWIGVS